MGETDPFVCLLCLEKQCAARPGSPGAPWGMSLCGPGRGGAFLPHRICHVAHHLANPGEPWRI